MSKIITILLSLLLLSGCSNISDINDNSTELENEEIPIVEVESFNTVKELNIFDNIKTVEINVLGHNVYEYSRTLTFKSQEAQTKFIDDIKQIESANIEAEDGSFVNFGREITDEPDNNWKENIRNYYNDTYALKPFSIKLIYNNGNSVEILQCITDSSDGIYIEGINGNNQSIKGYYYYNDYNIITDTVANLLKDDIPHARYVLASIGEYRDCDWLLPLRYEIDDYIITGEPYADYQGEIKLYFKEYIEDNENLEIYENGNLIEEMANDNQEHYYEIHDTNGNVYEIAYDYVNDTEGYFVPDYLYQETINE